MYKRRRRSIALQGSKGQKKPVGCQFQLWAAAVLVNRFFSSLLPPASLLLLLLLLLLFFGHHPEAATSIPYIYTRTHIPTLYIPQGAASHRACFLYYSLPLPPTALPVCRLRVFSCAPFGRLDQWVLVVHRRLLQTVAFLEPVQSSLHPYPLVILFYFHRQRHWFSFSFEIEIEQHWPMCVVLITQGISMLDCELISI